MLLHKWPFLEDDQRFWCCADDDGGDDGGGDDGGSGTGSSAGGGAGGGDSGGDSGGTDTSATDTSGGNAGGQGDTGQGDDTGSSTDTSGTNAGGQGDTGGAPGGTDTGNAGNAGGTQDTGGATGPAGESATSMAGGGGPQGDSPGGPVGDAPASSLGSDAQAALAGAGPSTAATAAGLGGGISSPADILAGSQGPVAQALAGDGTQLAAANQYPGGLAGETIIDGTPPGNLPNNLPGATTADAIANTQLPGVGNNPFDMASQQTIQAANQPGWTVNADYVAPTGQNAQLPADSVSNALANAPSLTADQMAQSPVRDTVTGLTNGGLTGGLPSDSIAATNPNAAPGTFQANALDPNVQNRLDATANVNTSQAALGFTDPNNPVGLSGVAGAQPGSTVNETQITAVPGSSVSPATMAGAQDPLGSNLVSPAGPASPGTQIASGPPSGAPSGQTSQGTPAVTEAQQPNVSQALGTGSDSAADGLGSTAGTQGSVAALSQPLTPQSLVQPIPAIPADGASTPSDGTSPFSLPNLPETSDGPNFNPEAGIYGPTYPGGAVQPAFQLPGGVSGPISGGINADDIAAGPNQNSNEGMFAALNNAVDTQDGVNINANQGIS